MRLHEHVVERIPKVEKHDHWCWFFVRNNLHRVSAIMLMMGHIREDLDCTCRRISVLNNTSFSFVPVSTNEMLALEGCYLYKDLSSGQFIRSGKTIGRSFSERHKEHQKCALSQDIRSKFYTRYPAKNATSSNGLRFGYFENLQQYCGLGFSRNSNAYKKLYMVEEGILRWDAKVIAELRKRSKSGEFQDKQLHLVGYLFELCYDLALSPNDNVS